MLITFSFPSKQTCDRCDEKPVVWFSGDDGKAFCRAHYRLWRRRRRQYKARQAKRARHWDSEAWARKYHGYVPRYIGGPFDGQRADVHDTSRKYPYGTPEHEARMQIESNEYVKKSGLHHYYHLSVADSSPIRWGEYLAGSLPAETSGVTPNTP